MPDTPFIVRAGALVADPAASQGIIENGALLFDGTSVAAVGTFTEISKAYPGLSVVGDETTIVMPGLINAHDHGRGLTPRSLGIEDDLLEMWIPSLMRMPALDAETDTALSALRQLKSGITTTVNSYFEPTQDETRIAAVLSGYARSGIRAGLIYSAMDQPATSQLLRAATGTMDDTLRRKAEAFLDSRPGFDMDLYLERLRSLATMEKTPRNWLMAGVVSGHWSSDAQLREVFETAEALGLHWQMHLLESAWQAHDNAGHPEGSLLCHLAALGVLNERLSCAHCVQTDADDFAVLAESGVSVVHNFSSNLRLKSGVAPIAAMRDAGVVVALGLDSMDFADRADMFDEMRRVHRHHGVLPAREVLCMATVNGAKALGRAEQTGRLLPGYRADLVVLDPSDSADPAPDSAQDVPDWIIASATPEMIRQVYVDGEAVIENGRHVRLDDDALVAELLEGVGAPATPTDRLALFAEAAPHIRALLSDRH